MTQKLTVIAKTGARTNIERDNVDFLAPVVIMAETDTDEIKMAKIKMREGLELNKALKSCLAHYKAYAYCFVREGHGTEFPNALLEAKGDFSLLPNEDCYGVIALHTGVKGQQHVTGSRAIVNSNEQGRTILDWEDELGVDEEVVSQYYVTDW